jgi:hypothetical protein
LFQEGSSRVALLQRLLSQHERRLREDGVADRELRTRTLVEFLQRAARLNPTLPEADLLVSARALASRNDIPILSNGDFLTRADQIFLQELGKAGQLTGVGAAVTALDRLEGNGPALLALDEEVRLVCRAYPLVAKFQSELLHCLGRHPLGRGKAEQVGAVLDHALRLSPDADVRPVLGQLFESFPLSGPDPRPLFRDLFRQVQRQAKRGYHDRFDRLCELLEEPA